MGGTTLITTNFGLYESRFLSIHQFGGFLGNTKPTWKPKGRPDLLLASPRSGSPLPLSEFNDLLSG